MTPPSSPTPPRSAVPEWDDTRGRVVEALRQAQAHDVSATCGPWLLDGDEDETKSVMFLRVDDGLVRGYHVASEIYSDSDAAFIAAARSGWPATVAALQKVMGLHQPGPMVEHREFGCTCGFQEHIAAHCLGCDDEVQWDRQDGYKGSKLCRTVAAVASVLVPAEPQTEENTK